MAGEGVGKRGNQNEEEGMTRNVASLRLVERPQGLFIWRMVNEESDQEEKEVASQGAWLVKGERSTRREEWEG